MDRTEEEDKVSQKDRSIHNKAAKTLPGWVDLSFSDY